MRRLLCERRIDMKIFNTLSRTKEEFVPLEEGKVKMYVCGPTVYNFIHIGNARPMIVFDTVRRYFEYKGYEVNYVSNFTDVDDKIIKKAIEEGVDAILVSHIITTSIDAEKPASVSAKTVALLRDELKYDGIIMTDDLAMSGITDYCTTGNAALEAILAGCDMLCCSNWDIQYPAVWQAVENGVITEERLNESAARILRVKYDMGLWE